MSSLDEDQYIEQLINDLNARLWQTRNEAVKALIRLGKPAAEPLMDAIKSNRFGVHYLPHAVEVLGDIGDESAVDLLIGILGSDHVHAAQQAAIALGKIRDPRAIQPLINAFRHDWNDEETITTWQETSTALAAIGQVALPALLTALNDKSSDVRQGVIDALGQLLDVRAVPALITILQDEDWHARANAAEALGHIGTQQVVKPLIALLMDEDAYVREKTCYALGDICELSVFEPLVNALSDPEAGVRKAAVVNLGRIHGLRVRGLDPDPEPESRRVAIESLKRTQGERIFDLFLEALKDPDGIVRSITAHVLGLSGDERALPFLRWIQQNDSGYAGANKVKDAATQAIQHIQERYSEKAMRHSPPPERNGDDTI